MNQPILQVQMFGAFTLRYGDRVISDNDDRSHRVWSLLAYMVYNRKRAFSQQELIDLYWSDGAGSNDPHNALKSIFHRIRASLDKLEDGFGRQLILRKAGRYFWNNNIPAAIDIEQFEELCRQGDAAKDTDARFTAYRSALALYRGDLLDKLTGEAWLSPIAARYHALYTRIAVYVIEQLEAQGRLDEGIALCREAIAIEPHQETLYEHLLTDLLRIGDNKGVMSIYEDMSETLFSNFGTMPSETLRALYRQAARTVNNRALTIDEVQAQLQEESAVGGAMLCEYDFFRILYRSEARSIGRTGSTVHICLLSVAAKDGSPLPRRSLDPAMENLKQLLPAGLRKGDVVSQCSVSQFIIMLPQANYENSRMVADRLVNAFYRRYPHSPVKLRYAVQPLEPLA